MNSVINVEGKDNIYLYGAGFFTKQIIPYLSRRDIDVKGVIVSKTDGNPNDIDGIPVWEISQLGLRIPKSEEIDLLICINNGKAIVGDMIEKYNWNSFEYVDFEIVNTLLNDFEIIFERKKTGFKLIMNYPNIEPGFAVICHEEDYTPFARVGIFQGISEVEKGLSYCKKEDFKALFGDVHYINGNNIPGFSEENGKIYVVTSHLDSLDVGEFKQRGYSPIQVGAVLTDIDKGCIKDSQGDNISDRNRNYCECTAHYWIWKNIKIDGYVGVNHYRRQQWFTDKSFEDIRENEIDVVLSTPQFTPVAVKDFFLNYNVKEDWDMLANAIANVEPDYVDAFNDVANGHFFFPCNIMTARKDFFDEYCSFAFNVAQEIEYLYLEIGVTKANRYIGFLIEVMESVFLRKHCGEFKVAFTDVSYIQPSSK